MPALIWLPSLSADTMVDTTATMVNFFRCYGPMVRSWEIGIEKLRRQRAKVAKDLVLFSCVDYVLNGFVLLSAKLHPKKKKKKKN
jgi:hypothetical protein